MTAGEKRMSGKSRGTAGSRCDTEEEEEKREEKNEGEERGRFSPSGSGSTRETLSVILPRAQTDRTPTHWGDADSSSGEATSCSISVETSSSLSPEEPRTSVEAREDRRETELDEPNVSSQC